MLRVDKNANEGAQARQPRSGNDPWPDMEQEESPLDDNGGDPLSDPMASPMTNPMSNPVHAAVAGGVRETISPHPPTPDEPRDSVEEPMVPPGQIPVPPGDIPPETPDTHAPGPTPPAEGARNLGPEADFGGSSIARMATRLGDDDPDSPLDAPPPRD